jgi:hypothetical protein
MANCGCTTTETTPSPACNCPPSPLPPWARPVQSTVTQLLQDAGNISLNNQTTFLDAGAGSGLAITIPDGNYVDQYKTIQVVSARVGVSADCETWTLAGTFAGFTTLTFDNIGYIAQLKWDGDAWVFLSGNATQNL